MSEPISSVFNDGYIAEQYEAFRRDPASVEESWRQYFRFAEQLAGTSGSSAGAADPDALRRMAGAANLAQAIRSFGHLAVQIDPLGTSPHGADELTPEFHGLTEADLAALPGSALGFDLPTAADAIALLRRRYSSNLAFEFAHLSEDEERKWFRDVLRAEELTAPLTAEEKKEVLRRLVQVDGLERFLGKAYVGYKRFSIEGTDALVPMLDAAIAESAKAGAREVAIGMAHRGRINVLTHVMGKPVATIFDEFEGRHPKTNAESETGDVKYHMGFTGRRTVAGRDVTLKLMPNPSHLEVVNPVLNGLARADQRASDDPRTRDEKAVLPIAIHGDAAFPGEGIVPETFNISRLRAYRVGGTLHIIVNNQVGFTTDPIDARSTHYASDIAKGFEVPVIHVNADDAEACVMAVRIAVAYRTRFAKDVVIDLVGYRRHGHNEGDEPTYTQPTLYAKIKAHPTPPQVWAKRLVSEGVVTQDEVAAIDREVWDAFAAVHAEVKKGASVPQHEAPVGPKAPAPAPIETAVPAKQLTAINERLLAWPKEFAPHPRLAKQLERRREALAAGDPAIDWGHAEALAFGSLLGEGMNIRLTGQDAERGTFSHRHAVLNDVNSAAKHAPLAHLSPKAAFEIYNSALSETAVMGFEYGYSVAAADTLVLWEAQFGDFANVAQPIIDQFIAADRAKWGQDSSLVLLLPHGYEGQGPEHSSARLERFLQLCAEGNLRVAYPTTPAQYFHVIRRQAKLRSRRPLVLMQPKSLLRLPQAASSLADLADGTFRPVIDDPRMTTKAARAQVRRVVLCTGKVYYDLVAKNPSAQVAVVRVEELYPWPAEEISALLDGYPAEVEVAWAQEEPRNMGAWTFVWPRLRVATGTKREIAYVGRPERASPAEGYASDHAEMQARIVSEALTPGTSEAGGGESTPAPKRKGATSKA